MNDSRLDDKHQNNKKDDSNIPSTDFDLLDRFIFNEKDVRVCYVNLQQVLDDNFASHEYPPFIKSLLCDFMLASVLLASNLKFDGRLVLQMRSNSELSLVMAECDSEGTLRSYAQYDDLPANFSFKNLESSTLAMTVEPRDGKAYQGIVPLLGESLSESLAFYFEQSEQLNTHFHFVQEGGRAAGFMLQQLPAQLEQSEQVRAEDWQTLQSLAATLSKGELLTLSGQTIMYRLYHEHSLNFLEQQPLAFSCSCSKERMDKALISLGVEELETILLEQGQISVNCEFCTLRYSYGEQDVKQLFASQSDNTVH